MILHMQIVRHRSDRNFLKILSYTAVHVMFVCCHDRVFLACVKIGRGYTNLTALADSCTEDFLMYQLTGIS